MAVIYKDVTSIREQRFENLVEQSTDFSCGAAALATLLNGCYDYDTTEVEVLQGMLETANVEKVAEKGFSLLDIKRYVATLGLRGRGYNIDNTFTLMRVRIPTIVLIDIKGYKHFVILKKITPEYAYIGDPALGNKIYTTDEFLEMWNNVIFAVLGQGFNRSSALLTPRESPLSISKSVALQSPLTDAELLDFGFAHSDMF